MSTQSTINALCLPKEHGFRSIAFPLIGAGSGGFSVNEAQKVMTEVLEREAGELDVVVVRWI